MHTPIAGRKAHVWRIDLDLNESGMRHAAAHLCEDEKKRAERLISPKNRRRFIVAHATVRVILGRYLGLEPENVAMTAGEYGKPGLVQTTDRPPIFFNLSHSAGMAIVGISMGRAIGVDIERVRPVSGMEGICGRFFTKPEARMLESAPDEAQRELFFRLWTMKEACLKAIGKGLRGLEDLPSLIGKPDDMTPSHPVPVAACLEISGRSWSVKRIFAASGYEAAVAIEGDAPWKMDFRRVESAF